MSCLKKIEKTFTESGLGWPKEIKSIPIRIAIFTNLLYYQDWILSVLDGKTYPFWNADRCEGCPFEEITKKIKKRSSCNKLTCPIVMLTFLALAHLFH